MFGEFNKLKLKNIAIIAHIHNCQKHNYYIRNFDLYFRDRIDNKLLEIYLCKILRQYANYLRKVFY